MQETVLHALNRFGLGRLGDEALPGDAPGWLHEQLVASDPGVTAQTPNIRDANEIIVRTDRYNDAKRRDPNSHPENDPAIGPLQMWHQIFERDVFATLRGAVRSATPARERLVMFWTNHFAVSAWATPPNILYAGPYVREAVRPNATGRFVDLLRACLHHPAMINYYSQQDSIGPNSPFGLARHRGINENLAREMLELFTLGLNAGYTQSDVTAVAPYPCQVRHWQSCSCHWHRSALSQSSCRRRSED